MYSIIKKTILFSSFTILAITACKKEEEEETVKPVEVAPVPTPTPTATNSFTWSENGGATITADSAYFQTQYNTIKAFKGSNFMEINLTAGAAATCAIPANAILYLVGSNLYTAASGSIVVSANASAKITGTFTSSGSGASITSVSGTFSNIPVR